MLHRLSFRLLTLAVAASAAIAAPASTMTAHADSSGTTDQVLAQQALAQAKALFHPSHSSSLSAREAIVPGAHSSRDATLVLRDLAMRADDLPTADQRALAKRILARPTVSDDPTGGAEPKYTPGSPVGTDCGPDICVHWVEDGSAQSVAGDGDVSTVPAWVTTTLQTMEHVYDVEVTQFGYNPPRPDGTSDPDTGGNDELDVYLADVGADGLYGYCTSDDPDISRAPTVSAYCVLDNDYKPRQFPDNTPTENLQVTAAHEFFHAIQYAYSWAQDEWLMEGTAAWMEDEVYNSVNDNRQYLAVSPLTRSWHPLDHGDYTDPYFPPYGSWIFWRFLSESYGPGSADDRDIIKEVWEHAITETSTMAVRRVLTSHDSSFATAFARFGTWSRNPSRYFREGSAYRAATLSHSGFTLTHSAPSTGNRTTHIDHMAQRYYRFLPGSSLTGSWRLRLSVNMADTTHGSLAQVSVHWRSGALTVVPIRLDKRGNGHRSVDFNRSSVSSVELDLINDSTRFVCNQGTDETCGGYAYDDGRTDVFRATAWR